MVIDFSGVFRGRSVAVTGDTGFKGSWLSALLLELGAKVHGFALPPEEPQAHYHRLRLASRLRHTDGDIRDLAALQRFFAAARPEFVFHLAAQSLVRRSYADPKTTFDTNVGGFVNVLECLRASETLKAAVMVTSDKCYLNKEWSWGYRENDELGGKDPYSASKAAAELVFKAYHESYFKSAKFGVATARAGNVIGGGDWAEDRIVPDCIRALRAGEAIVLRNPASTRPWQHVLEPLSGYLTLAAALARAPATFAGAWNFGPPGDAIRTVEDVARGIVSRWGGGRVTVQPDANPLHEARLLHLNCDRARLELGWAPRWDFDRTVRETADWYKAESDAGDPAEMTLRQIRSYLGGTP